MRTLFIILMLACGGSLGQPVDDGKSVTGKNATKSQLGSERSPIYIKKLGTDEDRLAENEEKRERERMSALNGETLEIAKEAKNAAVSATRFSGYGLAISIALVAIAFLQYRMFVVQLALMESSNQTAASAARAALIQAESWLNAERAYVKMCHVEPGIKRISEQSSVVRVEVKNWGRTPAQVTDVLIAFQKLDFGDPLPIPYPYQDAERESFPNGFLVPGESIYVDRHLRPDQVSNTDKQLWVFGHVDYIDIFGMRWRGGYARKYVDRSDGNLAYNTEGRDNFDLQRSPSEGRDWDKESIAAFKEKARGKACA